MNLLSRNIHYSLSAKDYSSRNIQYFFLERDYFRRKIQYSSSAKDYSSRNIQYSSREKEYFSRNIQSFLSRKVLFQRIIESSQRKDCINTKGCDNKYFVAQPLVILFIVGIYIFASISMVSEAIINSSSVGTTQIFTEDSGVLSNTSLLREALLSS